MGHVVRWSTLAVLLVGIVAIPGTKIRAAGLGAPVKSLPTNVVLTPSLPSPQPVGTSITWAATATDTMPLVYQFGVGTASSGPFTMVRDFSPRNTFAMARIEQGAFFVQVTVKEGYTATATASATAPFTLTSRVVGGQPAVSLTANPLVALYSAPACSAGHMRVAFQPVGGQSWSYTNREQCRAGLSRNFLVAGMLANTTYQLVNVVYNGGTPITSTALQLTTGTVPPSVTFPTVTVPQAPGSQSDTAEGMLMHILAPQPSATAANPFATNLAGQVTWYANVQDLSVVWALRYQSVRGDLGSLIYLTGDDGQQANVDDALRTIDLAGNAVQETDIQSVNTQLAARGQEQIYGFHHDALPLPNGDLAVLGFTEQTEPFTTTPYLGDMLIVLDKNLQVSWTWDEFNYLDPYRAPTLGDSCAPPTPPFLCPVPGYPNVVDWTHSNAIAWSPADHNIVVSVRSQDWAVKVNYANGAGDGKILWRMGPSGDFRIVPAHPSDPYPWFSHQHDFNYLDGTTVTLFDNGNTRCAILPQPCHSRGMVLSLNEQTKVVTQTMAVDVGAYSFALGTAQRLTNGNYNFTAGFQASPPPPFAQDIEELGDGSGTTEFKQQLSTPEYRAWRLATLYSPINPPLS